MTYYIYTNEKSDNYSSNMILLSKILLIIVKVPKGFLLFTSINPFVFWINENWSIMISWFKSKFIWHFVVFLIEVFLIFTD